MYVEIFALHNLKFNMGMYSICGIKSVLCEVVFLKLNKKLIKSQTLTTLNKN